MCSSDLRRRPPPLILGRRRSLHLSVTKSPVVLEVPETFRLLRTSGPFHAQLPPVVCISPRIHLPEPAAGQQESDVNTPIHSPPMRSPGPAELARLKQMPAWPKSGFGCMMLHDSGQSVLYMISNSKLQSAFYVRAARPEASYALC